MNAVLADELRAVALRDVLIEVLKEDPVAHRVRLVHFPSSGHTVLIVDNVVMYSVSPSGEVKREKRDAYPAPDQLAQETLSDVSWSERSVETLVSRAKAASERRQRIKAL